MIPEESDLDTWWEHVYRYRFATRFVIGKACLDIACGEGYGAAAMAAAGARSVIAVDISEEAVQHACRKYGLDARVGSAERIPACDGAVDVVVSFETIEHVSNPRQFLDECRRVCRPGGVVVVSTPNRAVYRAGMDPNPFHCSEMHFGEFLAEMKSRFDNVRIYGQRPARLGPLNPRVLATSDSALYKLPGMRRFQRLLRRKLCPEIALPLTSERRNAIIEMILLRRSSLAAYVNPYDLRKIGARSAESSTYFVAVGRRPAK